MGEREGAEGWRLLGEMELKNVHDGPKQEARNRNTNKIWLESRFRGRMRLNERGTSMEGRKTSATEKGEENGGGAL